MKTSPQAKKADPRHERRRTVMRIFEEEGWGSLELVDGWDGEELEELRPILSDQEFQTLLDRLKDQDGERG